MLAAARIAVLGTRRFTWSWPALTQLGLSAHQNWRLVRCSSTDSRLFLSCTHPVVSYSSILPRMCSRLLQRLIVAISDGWMILLREGLLELFGHYLGRACLEVTWVSTYEESCLWDWPLEEARWFSVSIVCCRRSLLNLLWWTLFKQKAHSVLSSHCWSCQRALPL